MYVCMYYGHHIWQSMNQPGKVAKPARGQLNRENEYLAVPIRAWDFGLARRVRPSRPASDCSFSIPSLNLVLTHGIPPDFRGSVHLLILTAIHHRASFEFIGLRICVPNSVHCRESVRTGPVVLKV